jgi:hypothetical protein
MQLNNYLQDIPGSIEAGHKENYMLEPHLYEGKTWGCVSISMLIFTDIFLKGFKRIGLPKDVGIGLWNGKICFYYVFST